MSGGTIPDRGYYAVHAGDGGPRVGELDEEMVFETRAGDAILLGAPAPWRVDVITRDRVIVSPAPGEPGRLPFWRGEGPGRPLELGRAIGALRARARRAHRRRVPSSTCMRTSRSTTNAAKNLVAYVHEQQAHTGALPTDRAVTIERFRDELGDWRVCILTPFGARVHAPWALRRAARPEPASGFEVQSSYTDDGIVLRFADVDELPATALLMPDPDELDRAGDVGARAERRSSPGRFRENAARALLLARSGPQRNPLWAQRLRARDLLAVVRRYPDFPIVIETYREILGEVFDLAEPGGIAATDPQPRDRGPRRGDARRVAFARSLVFAHLAEHVYEQDAPLCGRRGERADARSRPPAVPARAGRAARAHRRGRARDARRAAQGTADDRRARDPDELHDLLRRVGDLDRAEVRARCEGDAEAWLAALTAQWRAVPAELAVGRRWIAAEDAGLYRDALAARCAGGTARALSHGRRESRWRRCCVASRIRAGPFVTDEVATRVSPVGGRG